MPKPKVNLVQQFWRSQKKPIFFFGFIILAIGLGFYSSYSNTQAAKKWSSQVTEQVTNIEQNAILLSKQTEFAAKKNQVDNLLTQVNSNTKSLESQDEQVNLKSYNLKLYYNNYLEIHKKNLTKIQANLARGSEIEKLDKWDIRMFQQLEALVQAKDRSIEYPISKTNITQEYKLGTQLLTKLEDYIKQSTDTVLIGKLVSLRDYYKSIIDWYQKIDFFQESSSIIPTSEQILAKKNELENLTKVPKSTTVIFTDIAPSNIFTAELINSKNSLIKIIKRVNE